MGLSSAKFQHSISILRPIAHLKYTLIVVRIASSHSSLSSLIRSLLKTFHRSIARSWVGERVLDSLLPLKPIIQLPLAT